MYDQHHGSSPIDTAKKCFLDNLDRFGNAQHEAENYNLYNGLANLAIAIEQIEERIRFIESTVNRIEQNPR